MSKVGAASLKKTIAKMLTHQHSIVIDTDDGPDLVTYDTEHTPPKYYVVMSEEAGYFKRHSTAKAAAADFVRTVGLNRATQAVRKTQADAKAYKDVTNALSGRRS